MGNFSIFASFPWEVVPATAALISSSWASIHWMVWQACSRSLTLSTGARVM